MITTKSGDTLTLTAALVDGVTGNVIDPSLVSDVWVKVGTLYEWTLTDTNNVDVQGTNVRISMTEAQTKPLQGNQPIYIKVGLTDNRSSTIVGGELVQFSTSPLTEDY